MVGFADYNQNYYISLMPTLDNTFLRNNSEFKGIRILAFLLLIASTSFVTISSGFAVGMLEDNKKEQTPLSPLDPYGISQAQSDEVEPNANVPATISHHEGAMQMPILDTVPLPQHVTPTGPIDASDDTLEQNNERVSQEQLQLQQEQFQAPVAIPETSLQQQLPPLPPPPVDIANQPQLQQQQDQLQLQQEQFQAPVAIPETSLQQQLPPLPPPPVDIANQPQLQLQQDQL